MRRHQGVRGVACRSTCNLRDPDRDTVLYPAISYPTYEMGATLAGLRAVPYLHLDDIAEADAARALLRLGQLAGQPDRRAARPRRRRGVGTRARRAGAVRRVLRRVHLARGRRRRRSCARASRACSRCTRCPSATTSPAPGSASTPAIRSSCTTCARCASTSGSCRPGPVQSAAVVALDDDAHVELQRERYLRRLRRARRHARALPATRARCPDGAFYLWVAAPGGDAWAAARDLAERAGIVVSPGEFYGAGGQGILPGRGGPARRSHRAGRRRAFGNRVPETRRHRSCLRCRRWPRCSTGTRSGRPGTR